MPTNWKLGRTCTLSINGQQLTLARDVTVTMGSAEADVTTRSTQGVRQTIVALKELEISGTTLYTSDNPGVSELLNNYGNNAGVDVTLSDPPITYSGKWIVASLTNGQPVADVATLDFTLKPTLPESTV